MSEANESNRHTNTVRVYVEDVDYMGIVYHANYLCYLERSRTELLRKNGFILSDLQQMDLLFAVTELTIKYILPARLDDLLTVNTTVQKMKAYGFVLEQEIVNQNMQLVCQATMKIVCLSSELKPKLLPKKLKELMAPSVLEIKSE